MDIKLIPTKFKGTLNSKPSGAQAERIAMARRILQEQHDPELKAKLIGPLKSGIQSVPAGTSIREINRYLYALPLLDGDSALSMTIEQESTANIDLTLDVLGAFGINIATDKARKRKNTKKYYFFGNQEYHEPTDIVIDGDWRDAAFWLAGGALGGDVTIRGLRLDSSQWDKEIINIMYRMGARLRVTERSDGTCDVNSMACQLHGIELDVSHIPDLIPVLSVLMAAAEGTSLMTHTDKISNRDCERLKSMYSILSTIGADISYGGDSLSFTGVESFRGGVVQSKSDHRIIMAASIASTMCASPLTVTDAQTVCESYPAFFNDYTALGGSIKFIRNRR